MSAKLAICIPTYQNKEYIEDRIREELDNYVKNDFDLYIFDSSADNDTEYLVKQYQKKYKNLHYFRYSQEIPSNVKVYNMFQMAGKEILCDYIWMRSDALRCDETLLNVLPYYLEDGYDFILTSYQGKRKQGIRVVDNVQLLFENHAWQFCLYGAVILNVHSMLDDVDWDYMEKRYCTKEIINFSHLCLYFEQLVHMKKFQGLIMDLPEALFSGSKKKYSTWHRDTFDLWLRRWPKAIWTLPEIYHNKLKAIRSMGKNTFLYTYRNLRVLSDEEILTSSVYEKFQSLIIKYAGVSERRFYEFAYDLVPQNVLSKYNTKEYRLLQRFVCKHKIVVIYGCGKKGTSYAEFLMSIGKDFEMFIVSAQSKDRNKHTYMQHNVVVLDDFLEGDFRTKKVGIILGIGPKVQSEIFPLLLEKRVTDNVFSFPDSYRYWKEFFSKISTHAVG